jgi:hypothetical protein
MAEIEDSAASRGDVHEETRPVEEEDDDFEVIGDGEGDAQTISDSCSTIGEEVCCKCFKIINYVAVQTVRENVLDQPPPLPSTEVVVEHFVDAPNSPVPTENAHVLPEDDMFVAYRLLIEYHKYALLQCQYDREHTFG